MLKAGRQLRSGTNIGKAAGFFLLHYGGLEGNQIFLRGAVPKDIQIGLSTVCETLGSKTEEDAAEGFPDENPKGGFRLSLGERKEKLPGCKPRVCTA